MRAQWFGGMGNPEEGPLTDTERDTHSSPLCPCELLDLSREGRRDGLLPFVLTTGKLYWETKGMEHQTSPPPRPPAKSKMSLEHSHLGP